MVVPVANLIQLHSFVQLHGNEHQTTSTITSALIDLGGKDGWWCRGVDCRRLVGSSLLLSALAHVLLVEQDQQTNKGTVAQNLFVPPCPTVAVSSFSHLHSTLHGANKARRDATDRPPAHRPTVAIALLAVDHVWTHGARLASLLPCLPGLVDSLPFLPRLRLVATTTRPSSCPLSPSLSLSLSRPPAVITLPPPPHTHTPTHLNQHLLHWATQQQPPTTSSVSAACLLRQAQPRAVLLSCVADSLSLSLTFTQAPSVALSLLVDLATDATRHYCEESTSNEEHGTSDQRHAHLTDADLVRWQSCVRTAIRRREEAAGAGTTASDTSLLPPPLPPPSTDPTSVTPFAPVGPCLSLSLSLSAFLCSLCPPSWDDEAFSVSRRGGRKRRRERVADWAGGARRRAARSAAGVSAGAATRQPRRFGLRRLVAVHGQLQRLSPTVQPGRPAELLSALSTCLTQGHVKQVAGPGREGSGTTAPARDADRGGGTAVGWEEARFVSCLSLDEALTFAAAVHPDLVGHVQNVQSMVEGQTTAAP